ncbi:hypothetical protein HPB48_010607 [Haemaphysalis longicornis]|uniref:Globin domain-containing protein n=1 Tax=Haemaphysalis longicornis TaxID=44386 RepID=A0A9J6GUK6_HAELO|nr:hypothetical protein HPB48_010607 [Haemaphysalis longicornis]
MGNASRKAGDLPEEESGLTENQMKLIKDTWHRFCDRTPESGVLVFVWLFAQHPEFVELFPSFRSKPLRTFKDDPAFRAHGCAIGYHISSLVDSLGDPAQFEVLVRRNATEHLKRDGVQPHHFEVMGNCLVDLLHSQDEKRMTPAAIEAWQKLLSVSTVALPVPESISLLRYPLKIVGQS